LSVFSKNFIQPRTTAGKKKLVICHLLDGKNDFSDVNYDDDALILMLMMMLMMFTLYSQHMALKQCTSRRQFLLNQLPSLVCVRFDFPQKERLKADLYRSYALPVTKLTVTDHCMGLKTEMPTREITQSCYPFLVFQLEDSLACLYLAVILQIKKK